MRRHVCFYRTNVAALVSGTPVCAMGGADLRAWEFARRLAKIDDFRVTFVVGDFGQPAMREREGVAIRVRRELWRRHVYVAYRNYQGSLEGLRNGRYGAPAVSLLRSLPWLLTDRALRMVLPRRPQQAVDRLLVEELPDLVICFGATPDAADVVAACRRREIPTILCVTGDSQLEKAPDTRTNGAAGRDAAAKVELAFEEATEIVVQSEDQQRVVEGTVGRTAHLIRNPALPLAQTPPAGKPAVLWVGRAELDHKRPDRLWEVARRLPDVPFRVIMNRDAPGVWERLASDKPANIELIDRVPPDQMGGYFGSAAILLNTSASEGFPNAFLQAASAGVAVVSCEVDPAGFLSRHGCGVCCGGELDKTVAELSRLWRDAHMRDAMAERGRRYVAEFHDPELCARQMADLCVLLSPPFRSAATAINV